MRLVAAGALVLALPACSQTAKPNAVPIKPAATLSGWPRSAVNVLVEDFRPEKGDESASVVAAVRDSIVGSLDPSRTVVGPRYQLKILVSEYGGQFTLGNWNGTARLKAALSDETGIVLKTFEASGTARRGNLWGTRTARDVSRDSLRSAVADLTAQMALAPLPK